MRLPKVTTIDFESMGIEGRPKYPPVPVGVSIKYWGRKSKYYAWGHPTGNNCSLGEAVDALNKAYATKDGILFQNAKFDLDVAETHLKIKLPDWSKVHDTVFLLFLDDPNQTELGLKESANRLLDWKPEEQDAVADWLITNQPVPGVRISKSKGSENYFGKFIAWVPGDIVGKYAKGDTDRTEALFKLLYPEINDRGMMDAYNRERKLMFILLEMERQGLPVDLKKLEHDVLEYEKLLTTINNWVIEKLKADPDINLNSGQQLFNAMLDSGFVDESKAPLTATGKYQTNKDALLIAVNNKQLLAILKYRSQLSTCLHTFMQPWLKIAKQSNGFIYTTWNQVKAPKGKDTAGTRTGRLSSTPNFQNIPHEFDPIFSYEKRGLPTNPFKVKLPLPRVRSYVVPFKDDVFIDRDYSQQEPRILAHFDGGALMNKYREDPWIDFHNYAQAELAAVGKIYDRKPVKNTNLGLIYGMGAPKLAEKNDMTVEESSDLKKAILLLYPGLSDMYSDMRTRAAHNQPIKTWGGREYYCEDPKVINGRLRKFDYKMVNALIQGSAADCTKEAMIRYHAVKHKDAKIVLQIHDQLTVSVPSKILKSEMEVLRKCVESIEFDVQMLSEGAISRTNWDDLEDYDKKGVIL